MSSQNYTAADFPVADTKMKRTVAQWVEILDNDTLPSPEPKLTYIVGQPGAGKSARIDSIIASAPAETFPIDSDVIRLGHPNMAEILATDPISMDVLSNDIVGPVTVALLDHARESKQSLLLENTLTNTQTVSSTIDAFRKAGYAVDMHVVATPAQISQIGILDRYAQALRNPIFHARWTRPLAHETAYNSIPKGLVALQGKVDTVIVNSRQKGEVYRGTDMQQASETLQRVRKEDWNDQAKAYFAEKYIKNQHLLKDRDFTAHPHVAPLLKSLDETAQSISDYVRAAQNKLAQPISPTALVRKMRMENYSAEKTQSQG